VRGENHLEESAVRKHLRRHLEKLDYEVWDQEEKQIIPGVRSDLIASTRSPPRRVMAVETKGSRGNAKQAVGQAATYLVSDLISESYVAIPRDLFERSQYVKDVCDAVGVGLFTVDDDGRVIKEQGAGRSNTISSASMWGNRRNGAPDTSRINDLKLAVLAVATGSQTEEEIINYIQKRRINVRNSKPIGKGFAEVFLHDATQMGLTIRLVDGTYVLSPLGRTLFEINPNPVVNEEEKRLLHSSIFNFPTAYMVFRILRRKGAQMHPKHILEEGAKLENEIAMDGVFQTAFRRKYHLNEQRLAATLNLMTDLGILNKRNSEVELGFRELK